MSKKSLKVPIVAETPPEWKTQTGEMVYSYHMSYRFVMGNGIVSFGDGIYSFKKKLNRHILADMRRVIAESLMMDPNYAKIGLLGEIIIMSIYEFEPETA